VRQQAFLAGLAHEVLSAGTLADPARLSALITAGGRYVVVDPGWDLLAFAGKARSLTGGGIRFRTIPTGSLALHTPSDGVAVQVDPAQVRAFIAATLTGTAPKPASARAPVTVDVRNATPRAGLATGVLGLLGHDGFVPGTLGTATSATRSTVLTAPATRTAAEQVATLLGGLPVRTDHAVPTGHVQVVLGRGYAGPSGTAPTPATPDPAGPGATGDHRRRRAVRELSALPTSGDAVRGITSRW
jgi:hypothetical protein